LQAALHGLHGGDAFVELVDVCLGNVLDLGTGPQFVAPQGQELADFFYRKAQIAAAADKALGVRTDSGYRQYTANDVHTLRFIRRCRDLGFSIEEIRQLLALWRDKLRASAQVKHIAQAHIHQLNERIAAMQAMQRSLQMLVSCCKGDERPDCPILDDLGSPL
jgi:Cu(I)-responsive transcriptional regulator